MRTFDELVEYKNDNPHWGLLKDLYEKNYLGFARPYKPLAPHIPKKIHQIWLGGELPQQYRKWTKSWKTINPDWEYRLWTDENIDIVDIPNRELFNSIKNLGQKSDYLRYHILNQFGGVYVDTDFECLKPFNPLGVYEFITGISYNTEPELYIGLIGCKPYHRIMQRIVKEMDTIQDKNWREIFNTTGTYFFTRMFFEEVQKYEKGIVAMPPAYFYPFPNYIRDSVEDGKIFIKDYSYAIHYWEVSWNKNKKSYVS